jgi:hypothetical protein
MLSTPLTRLLDLVTDDNASNDMAACGEADALRASAATIAISLGCH